MSNTFRLYNNPAIVHEFCYFSEHGFFVYVLLEFAVVSTPFSEFLLVEYDGSYHFRATTSTDFVASLAPRNN